MCGKRFFAEGGNAAGFTLLELIASVVIFAGLAGIAFPGVSGWLQNYRLMCAARDVYSNFQMAKLAAIRSGCYCTITFNQPLEGVTYDYVVFVDRDRDLEYDADATVDGMDNDDDGVVDEPGESEVILKKVMLRDFGNIQYDPSKGGGDGLTFFKNDDGLPCIAFRPNGLPRNNGGGFGAGTVSLTNRRNRTAQIVISSVGRIRIA
jgi:prepilin-type N-terminal cleavage/methylation domain-containing protein